MAKKLCFDEMNAIPAESRKERDSSAGPFFNVPLHHDLSTESSVRWTKCDRSKVLQTEYEKILCLTIGKRKAWFGDIQSEEHQKDQPQLPITVELCASYDPSAAYELNGMGFTDYTEITHV